MSDELHDKIARLPVWAREHIKRLQSQANPENERCRILQSRVTHLEEQLRKARDREEAMVNIFRDAARGGNETAQAFVDRVVSEWCPPDEVEVDLQKEAKRVS